MIPKFPQFKKLKFRDKKDIERITHKFAPYSDFNFISMWSWNIKNEMLISQIHGNLVVRFTDYVTGEPFYSFLGNHEVNKTVKALLELSKKEGLELKLKLIPEASIKGIDLTKFKVEEDRDNFDYIILTRVVKNYDTKKTKSRRKAVNNLLKNTQLETRMLDLSSSCIIKQIFKLITNKDFNNKNVDNEFMAISRLITRNKFIKFFPIGIFIELDLVGFCFCEIIKNDFAISHFWRTDTEVSQSLYAYLMQQKAILLHKNDCKYINIEQDLGLENLRKWKSSYDTEIFLKKYIINND